MNFATLSFNLNPKSDKTIYYTLQSNYFSILLLILVGFTVLKSYYKTKILKHCEYNLNDEALVHWKKVRGKIIRIDT